MNTHSLNPKDIKLVRPRSLPGGVMKERDGRIVLSSAARPEENFAHAEQDLYTSYTTVEGNIGHLLYQSTPVQYAKGSFWQSEGAMRIADPSVFIGTDLSGFNRVQLESTRNIGWDITAFGLGHREDQLGAYSGPESAGLREGEKMELASLVARGRELRLMTEASTAANFPSATTAIGATARFNAVGGTYPVTTINAAKRRVLQRGGVAANVMVIGFEVRDILMEHPQILTYLSPNGSGSGSIARASLSQLAQAFGLHIIVSEGGYENDAGTFVPFWPRDSVLVCYQQNIEAMLTEVTTLPAPARGEGGQGLVPARPQSCLANYYLEPLGEGIMMQEYEENNAPNAPMVTELMFVEDPIVARPRRGELLTTVIN